MTTNGDYAVLLLYCYTPDLLRDLNRNIDKIIFQTIPRSVILEGRVWYFIDFGDPQLSQVWVRLNHHLTQTHSRIGTVYFYKPNAADRISDHILFRAIIDKQIEINQQIH